MLHAVKKTLLGALCLLSLTSAKIEVRSLRIAGPYGMQHPLMTDTTDFNGKAFDMDQILKDSPLPLNAWKNGITNTDGVLAAQTSSTISIAGFQVECSLFAKCNIQVKGVERYDIFVNGKQESQPQLIPGRHDVVIRIQQKAGETDTLSVWLESEQDRYLTIHPEGKRIYTLEDYMHGTRAGSISLSSTGRFLLQNTSITRTDGKTEWNKRIVDLQTQQEIPIQENFVQWTATRDQYIRSKKNADMSTTYEYVEPMTGKCTPFFTDYTNSEGYFIANEKMMLISKRTEGPKEDSQVFQILYPDDRLKGWRDRNNIQLMDVSTGRVRPLTVGQHNVYATPSHDGNRIALMVSESCITERPFRFTSILILDPLTMQTDTLVRRDGFIEQVQWSADDKRLYISGSPEAFDGIGRNDPTGKIPSMIQTELFEMDLQSRKVRSLTWDFNPNLIDWQVSEADGNIYARCENRDRKDLFCLDTKQEKWTQLLLSENVIADFSLSDQKPYLAYYGQSESNSDRVYLYDLKKGREQLLFDYNAERTADVQLGECRDWNFQSSRGDSIYGRYYLPPHFDPNKQYPMLVYYYGGCSPVSRQLDSYYHYHGWASMGYIVYVIQPSGCTGFGQEFAARHVNAYGSYTADDIIEGTQQFCQEHPFVNNKKIGCLGASYGGFMTMYLQTVTDIFAAAMAHAGISNPASYWGFGNWGYSYNAIAAANSYPWNNAELMSARSPLFNADKVHTPILFLHGNTDDNVPIAESTQMFNALKILGKDCAFVTIDGQGHHILDYSKRIKWVHTFYAWFAKYLQDDPTWWETLYPTKNMK